MVLRKSEYRKNYKWFSPDKRNALWLENALYRAERRQREYGHEPLGDEADSGYEVGDSESEECGLPPTKLRQRRLQLIAAATAKPAEDDVDDGRHRKSTTPQSPQAAPRRRPAEKIDARSLAPSDKHVVTQTVRPAKRDIAVQTVLADIMRLPRVTQDHKRRTRSRYRGSPRKEPEHCRHCFALWGAPFENFGWADDVDTIGTKQTFNVAASTNEVYPSAQAAARTRQRSPTPPPPMQRKTFRSARPHSAPPKDRRLWISEYREQYR
ncbi:uncharacterized protein LOC142587681 [Dermacentor variabilis]|uniref:uncharacterized protein LOC142587681 n=1 Tax=Dermacentor variabilis TaxID=34621 RepID=UPI003F5C5ECA